ncbi:PEGA domain-containing protein [Salinibacter ruber]|uniref:PEGA domain-containing protein n=1 Tax=Salinibacter ruber TaxID=146919 RepID=UPI002154FAA9
MLRATPDRATVALDGEEVGATPATLTEVTTGTYEVTFSRPGHKTVTRRVDVSATDTDGDGNAEAAHRTPPRAGPPLGLHLHRRPAPR